MSNEAAQHIRSIHFLIIKAYYTYALAVLREHPVYGVTQCLILI